MRSNLNVETFFFIGDQHFWKSQFLNSHSIDFSFYFFEFYIQTHSEQLSVYVT